MKVLLRKNVDDLGESGEIVEVKAGYGRNYLIPRGLARIATPGTIRAHAEEERQQARKRMQKKEEAQEVKKQIENTVLEFPMRVGEENRIFGTITNQQIAVELNKRGFDIDRRNVELQEEVRTTGSFHANVNVFQDVDADLTINVVPMSEI